MRYRRLCKAASSWGKDDCPAVYVADDEPARMIAQGKMLDPAVLETLVSMAIDETAVEIPTETVLRAAGVFLAEHGRPDLREAIEELLAQTGLAVTA